MAEISLGESKWRMLRRVLRKKTFGFEDCRNQSRRDGAHFDWLVARGFLAAAGDGRYELTEKGRKAADLGMHEV